MLTRKGGTTNNMDIAPWFDVVVEDRTQITHMTDKITHYYTMTHHKTDM